MKAKINQEALRKGLGVVSRGIPVKSVLPVIQNVLIEARDDCLYLAGTNLEFGLQAWLPAQVDEPGSITVSAKSLGNLVQTLVGDVQLKAKDNDLLISTKSTKAKLKGIAANEFPPMPAQIESGPVLDGELLKRMIEQVSISANPNDMAFPILNGVYLKLGDKLTMSTADGFRASRGQENITPIDPVSAIIPVKSMNELARIIEGPVQIKIEKGKIIFATSGIQLTSQLVEGDFPSVENVIPTRYTTKVELPVKETIRACKQAGIFTTESNRISIIIETDTVVIACESSEMGEVVTTIPARVEGEPIKIRLDVNYFAEALDTLKANAIAIMETTAHNHPVKFYSGTDVVHVVMPMVD